MYLLIKFRQEPNFLFLVFPFYTRYSHHSSDVRDDRHDRDNVHDVVRDDFLRAHKGVQRVFVLCPQNNFI